MKRLKIREFHAHAATATMCIVHFNREWFRTYYKQANAVLAITYTGFVAQEVEAAAKELGYDFSGVDAPKSENDYFGLRYAEFVVPLVKGMQEQQQMIEAQQKEINELKAIVKSLSETKK